MFFINNYIDYINLKNFGFNEPYDSQRLTLRQSENEPKIKYLTFIKLLKITY